MKIIIGIIITLFSLPAYAALPDMITDPATRDVIEYLDAKLEDVRDGVTGPRGYPGPKGDTGATGPAGATGATGPAGVGDVVLSATQTFTGANTFTGSVTASSFHGDGSGLSGVIPSTATGYYPLWVATATYALNGGGGGGVVDSTAVIDGLPIGTIIQFSTTTPPAGYLYCDGSYVSTTTYASLFAVTGHRYSTFTVSGSPAVFQLPDFRGMFARGADPTAIRDTTFRVVGSTQTDAFQGHDHTEGWAGINAAAAFGVRTVASGNINMQSGTSTNFHARTSPPADSTSGPVRVSTETRPENIAVAFMIKYGHVGTVAISSSSLLIGGDNTFTGANTFTGSVTVSSFTATGDTLFRGATSTATFSGWVDIGYEIVQNQASSNPVTATCPAGKKVLGGGCTNSSEGTALFIQDITATTVRCLWQSAGSWQRAYAICARIK